MSAYMQTQQARADKVLANFAAGVNHAVTREDQLKAVVAMTNEVERHAGAIDPAQPSAVSVLVDLVVELAQVGRHIANVMIADDRPAVSTGPVWPASLTDDEAPA